MYSFLNRLHTQCREHVVFVLTLKSSGRQEIVTYFDMGIIWSFIAEQLYDTSWFLTIVVNLIWYGRDCLGSYMMDSFLRAYNASILASKAAEGKEYVIEVDRRLYSLLCLVNFIVAYLVIMSIYCRITTYIEARLRLRQ